MQVSYCVSLIESGMIFCTNIVKVSALGRSRPCDLICLGEGADPGQVCSLIRENFLNLTQARQVAARTALIYLKTLTGYQ